MKHFNKKLIFHTIRTLLVFVTLMFSSAFAATTGYTVPAEWEPHQGTWFGWPIFEPIQGKSNKPQILSMIKYIINQPTSEKIYIVVSNKNEESDARGMMAEEGISKNAINSKVAFYYIPRTDFWMRDYLNFSVTPNQANLNEMILGVTGFKFNAWAMGAASNYFNSIANTDDSIDTKIGEALKIPLLDSNYIMEGGGLEFNGEGDLIVSEAVMLQYERIYSQKEKVTKATATEELKRLFGVSNVIWLPKFKYNEATYKEEVIPESDPGYYLPGGSGGVVADDSTFYGPVSNPQPREYRDPIYQSAEFDLAFTSLTTNGHTDEIVRWVSNDTVLVAHVEDEEVVNLPPDDITVRTKQRLDKIQAVLAAQNTAAGKKINVIKIPVANEKVYYLKPGDGTYDGAATIAITWGKYKSISPSETIGSVFLGPNGNRGAFISARSYLNYVLTNDYVFMPRYATQDIDEDSSGLNKIKSSIKDQQAKAILEKYFGKGPFNKTGKIRTVVIIDNVDFVNIGGGGLHCITQQMPEGVINTIK